MVSEPFQEGLVVGFLTLAPFLFDDAKEADNAGKSGDGFHRLRTGQ